MYIQKRLLTHILAFLSIYTLSFVLDLYVSTSTWRLSHSSFRFLSFLYLSLNSLSRSTCLFLHFRFCFFCSCCRPTSLLLTPWSNFFLITLDSLVKFPHFPTHNSVMVNTIHSKTFLGVCSRLSVKHNRLWLSRHNDDFLD